MTYSASTLVEITRKRAADEPQKLAYTFLSFHPERMEKHLSYGELDAQARGIAERLRAVAHPGDRALLLYGNGPEFITAFLGCLYARVIAVPAPLARRGGGAERVRGILEDCRASLILCARSGHKTASALVGSAAELSTNLSWLVTDESLPDGDHIGYREEQPLPGDLAFLQYSSGSTGSPRGAMITHGNLLNQSALMHGIVGGTPKSCVVSWLPVFHDMGLIAGVLQPLYGGFRGVLMTPESFVESPQRWLQAMSDFGADFCAAPNFAYDLCVRRIPEEARAGLDLSRWRVASVAAEPVRAKTLDAFAAMFAPRGFAREAFQPGYGLAENTLVASLGNGGTGARIRCFESNAIEENRVLSCSEQDAGARRLVGCGVPAIDQTLLIAKPDGTRALSGEVGEIWIAGPSVSAGYWHRERETEETFHARLADGTGPYLRTGDLGFLHEGELFICGRLKDLIILAGRNHHAPDIEATVEACHPALPPSSGAAFSIEAGPGGEERLVVVQELERSFRASEEELRALLALIRQRIVEHHEVDPHDIVLVKQGTLPKTSSGKVRRIQCRRSYGEAALHVRASQGEAGRDPQNRSQGRSQGRSQDPSQAGAAVPEHLRAAEQWLIEEVARQAGPGAARVSAETAFAGLGLTAETEAGIVRAIELRYGCMLPGDILSDFPIVGLLAAQLATSAKKAQGSEGGEVQSQFAQSSAAGAAREPIAIVGIGCRFPGADGPRALWKLLADGEESITEVPFERWDVDEFYDSNVMAPGKMATRRGGFLKDVEQMDRNFFDLSVRETVRMDPQHRLMLETAWEAIEDAGIPAAKLSGTPVGVFVGIQGSDYAQRQFTDPALADAYAGQGSALTVAASRISHYFNFLGPAIAVDTACSSSLTAVHLACNSIHSGECTLALAGGVNMLLSPTATMCLSKAGMMAPDGRCKAFDAKANGYVRSEGAGVLVLKRFSEAVADGDPIYAVIRGTASNQDGHSSGLMAPNGEAQEAVVLAACRNAGIEPGDFDYVEAHGTGTPVGDPIELKALGNVLSIGRVPGRVCAVGSIKTNIGHSESAAGVAGLIKAALVLKHRLIPASLHFEEPNPMIPFDSIPVRIPTALGPLPERDRPSLVGVNGFGVGGTNVHIVLEEDVRSRVGTSAAPARPYLVPLSARSAQSLSGNAQALARVLREEEGSLDPRDVCFTAALRRGHLEHRLAVTGGSAAELAEALEQFGSAGSHPSAVAGTLGAASGEMPKLAFIFSGQGSQWFGMGRALLAREPVFRQVIEQCDALLLQSAGWSLLDLLCSDESRGRLDETQFVQPALFALQIAVAALLRSWGVVPDAVAGHSVGEVAAAYVAGALTLPDAIKLIAHRGRLMQAATGLGRMVNVEISHREVEPMLNGWSDRLSIAAVNSPQSVVLSGESDAMLRMLEKLDSHGINHVPLPVNYAFHSPQMDPFKDELEAVMHGLATLPLRIPMFSTVTAAWCKGEDLGANYWSANLRLPVLLAPAIEQMAADGTNIFMEIGPHPVLAGSIARTLKAKRSSAATVSTLRRDQDEQHALMLALGSLYTVGRPADWRKLYPSGEVVQTLPSYRWNRQRYWLDLPKPQQRLSDAHPLLGLRMAVAQPTWQSKLDAQAQPFLGDLQLNRQPMVLPNVFVEAALAAASELFGARPFQLTEIALGATAELRHGNQAFTIQVAASGEGSDALAIEVFTQTAAGASPDGEWQAHLRAHAAARPEIEPPAPLCLEELEALCPRHVEAGEYYQALDASGLHYGPSLRQEAVFRQGTGQALLRMRLGEEAAATLSRFRLHPAVLEAATHAARLAHGLAGLTLDPSGIQRIRLFGPCGEPCSLHARLRASAEPGEQIPRCDISLADEGGSVFATLEGMRFEQRVTGEDLAIPEKPEDWLYETAWVPAERAEAGTGSSAGGKTWILFADASGAGDRLLPYFQAKEQHCIVVRHGEEYGRPSTDSFVVDAANPEHLQRLFLEAFPEGGKTCRGLIHLWSLDSTPAANTSAASIDADQLFGSISILHLVQAVSATGFVRPPRLFLVSSGVHAIGADAASSALSQAMVWGLGKVLTIEHPELRCACVDLSPEVADADLEALYEECLSEEREDQVAFRGAERYAARLLRPASATAENGGAAPRRFAGADEVEIRVLAARLNRSRLDEAAGSDSCVGTVVAAGSEAKFRLGETVLVLDPDCRAPHLTVKATRVAALGPALLSALTDEQAAASVRPLVTALFALRDLARLRSGESVLIHGACSGLGLAAVQVAARLGARILVSAATERERAKLAALGLGQIVDADSLSSPSQLLAFTDRKGVDVLLNCLEGAPVPETIQALAVFGRYLDGTRTQSAMMRGVGGYKLQGGVSLQSIDLESLLAHAPARASALLAEVLALLEGGELKALPTRVSTREGLAALPQADLAPPLDEADEAEMAEAAEVIRFAAPEEAGRESLRQPVYRSEATYLITGGLGGIGLGLAERMVDRGARHLVLLGRRAPSEHALAVLARLRLRGASILVHSVDVADRSGLRSILEEARATMPPLRGILHAAGFLANELLVNMTAERFRAVLPSKAIGAWHLHTLSRELDLPLDFFVLFSSLASLLGSPGQGNYSAANAFLDGLAAHRRQLGLPALSVCWGPWAEIGMAAGEQAAVRMHAGGLGMLPPEAAFDLQERLLGEPTAAVVGAIPIDWLRWARMHPSGTDWPFVAALMPAGSQGSRRQGGKVSFAQLQQLDTDGRLGRLEEAIQDAVCQSLRLEPASLSMKVSLSAVGLDSLVALELKSRLEASIDVVVQTVSLLKGPSIRSLAEQFLAQMSSEEEPSGAAESAASEGAQAESVEVNLAQDAALAAMEPEQLLDAIPGLSDEEVDALLLTMTKEASL